MIGHAHGARSPRIANPAGNLLVGARFPIGNPDERLPDLPLESSAMEIERHGETPSASRGIFPEFSNCLAGEHGSLLIAPPSPNPFERRPLRTIAASVAPLQGIERQLAYSLLRTADRDLAKGRVSTLPVERVLRWVPLAGFAHEFNRLSLIPLYRLRAQMHRGCGKLV